MLENFDENIDINLKLLSEKDSRSMFLHEFVNRLGNRIRNPERFAELMQEKGLINLELGHRERCDLTTHGYEIATKGGWIKYLNTSDLIKQKEALEEQKEATIKEIDTKKLVNEYKLSNWKVKTFWPIFIIAVIGSSLGVYNFISSLSISENTEEREERIEKLEAELEKFKNSISDKKSLDSLNILKDSTEF